MAEELAKQQLANDRQQNKNKRSLLDGYRNTSNAHAIRNSSKTTNDIVVAQTFKDDDAEFLEAEDQSGGVRPSRNEMLAAVNVNYFFYKKNLEILFKFGEFRSCILF